MYITGSVVHVEGGGANYGYIEAPEYDDVMLLMAVEAYNKDKGIDPKLTG